MESLAQSKQTWSPLRFPSSPLSAFTIPQVTPAVRTEVAALFMRDYGYLVDHVGHSSFCMEAYQGGLVSESDLLPLMHYPNGYGLHLVTNRVVRNIESRIEFTIQDTLPDAERIGKMLGRGFYEIPYAAGIALAVTEAGLLTESELSPILASGPDCGFDLVVAAKKSVDALWPVEQREERNLEHGVVYKGTPFYTSIQGTDFVLEAHERNRFFFDWPELTPEFLELHIVLTKTLDAMSTYLIPFHTPASAMGSWSQYTGGISESYEGMKEVITGNSKSEIVEYLLEYGDADEMGWLGLEVSEDSENGEFDPDSVEHAAKMLWQMNDIDTNYSYRLSYGGGTSEQTRHAEMLELLTQVREISGKHIKYSKLTLALGDALECCMSYAQNHQSIESLVLGADPNGWEFDDSPNRFFDCIWVLSDLRHQALHQEAVECFNVYAEEHGIYSAKLPLTSGKMVAQITIPIMERTNKCLTLLRRIQLSLEVNSNA